MLNKQIEQLDDAAAANVLSAIAKQRLDSENPLTSLTSEHVELLKSSFGGGAQGDMPSEGDLARQALLLLAEEPDNKKAITALIQGPRPERFITGAEVAIIVSAIVVLQTRVSFERKTNGKWSLSINKPSLDSNVLGALAKKIVAFWTGNR